MFVLEDMFLSSKEIEFIRSDENTTRLPFEEIVGTLTSQFKVPQPLNRSILFIHSFFKLVRELKKEPFRGDGFCHVYQAVSDDLPQPLGKRFKKFVQESFVEDFVPNNESHWPLKLKNCRQVEVEKRLELVGLRLNRIDAQTFKLCQHLRELSCQQNELTRIDAGVLGLDELWSLSFRKNLIESIDPKAFKSLASLTNLDLSRNCLRSLDESVFRNLRHLKKLHLNSNLLERLPAKSLETLNYLSYLNLNENRLTSIEPGTFKYLSVLQSLCLSDNYLSRLEPSQYSFLRDLNNLGKYLTVKQNY